MNDKNEKRPSTSSSSHENTSINDNENNNCSQDSTINTTQPYEVPKITRRRAYGHVTKDGHGATKGTSKGDGTTTTTSTSSSSTTTSTTPGGQPSSTPLGISSASRIFATTTAPKIILHTKRPTLAGSISTGVITNSSNNINSNSQDNLSSSSSPQSQTPSSPMGSGPAGGGASLARRVTLHKKKPTPINSSNTSINTTSSESRDLDFNTSTTCGVTATTSSSNINVGNLRLNKPIDAMTNSGQKRRPPLRRRSSEDLFSKPSENVIPYSQTKTDCCIKMVDFKANEYESTYTISISLNQQKPILKLHRKVLTHNSDSMPADVTINLHELQIKDVPPRKLRLIHTANNNVVYFVMFEDEASCRCWASVIEAYTSNSQTSVISHGGEPAAGRRFYGYDFQRRLFQNIQTIAKLKGKKSSGDASANKDSDKSSPLNVSLPGSALDINHVCSMERLANGCIGRCVSSPEDKNVPLLVDLIMTVLERWFPLASGLYRVSGRRPVLDAACLASSKKLEEIDYQDLVSVFTNPQDLAHFHKMILRSLVPRIFGEDLIDYFVSHLSHAQPDKPIDLSSQKGVILFQKMEVIVDAEGIRETLKKLRDGILVKNFTIESKNCRFVANKPILIQERLYCTLKRLCRHIAVMSRFADAKEQRLDTKGLASMLAFNLHTSNDPVITNYMNQLLVSLSTEYEWYFEEELIVPDVSEYNSVPVIQTLQVKIPTEYRMSRTNSEPMLDKIDGNVEMPHVTSALFAINKAAFLSPQFIPRKPTDDLQQKVMAYVRHVIALALNNREEQKQQQQSKKIISPTSTTPMRKEKSIDIEEDKVSNFNESNSTRSSLQQDLDDSCSLFNEKTFGSSSSPSSDSLAQIRQHLEEVINMSSTKPTLRSALVNWLNHQINKMTNKITCLSPDSTDCPMSSPNMLNQLITYFMSTLQEQDSEFQKQIILQNLFKLLNEYENYDDLDGVSLSVSLNEDVNVSESETNVDNGKKNSEMQRNSTRSSLPVGE